MLIQFVFKNFRNFKKKSTLFMVNDAGVRLSLGGIYGENGSGKSSIIDALHIIQDAVVGGKGLSEDGEFILAFLVDEKTYLYKINAKGGSLNDSLFFVDNAGKERCIVSQGDGDKSIIFKRQEREEVLPAFKWFKEKLLIITPKDEKEIEENWKSLKETIPSYTPKEPKHLSSGEKELVNLTPLILDEPKVEVIVCDDFGQHIHPILCERLLEQFSSGYFSDDRFRQFIFTTNQTHLMKNALGVDEIHLCDRFGEDGNSTLVPLTVFDGIKDLENELEKHYLFGRFGGTP